MAINLGSTAISNIKLGSTQVSKVYLGATEVWSSQPPANEWGELSYYSVWSDGWNVASVSKCTATIVDQSKITPFLEEAGAPTSGTVQIRYSSNRGGWYQIGGVTVTAMTSEALSSASGIDVAVTSGATSAYVRIKLETIVDTTSPIVTRILTQTEYEALGTTNSEYDFGTLQLPNRAVVSFSFGTLATSTPEWFLYASTVQSIDFSNATSLTSIGNNFIRGCESINSSIILPSGVTSIGNSFLAMTYTYNSPVILPTGLLSIGKEFLWYCTSFNNPLTLPNTITSIGTAFLSECQSMVSTVDIGTLSSNIIESSDNTFSTSTGSAPSYQVGLPIKGTYANDWKTKFPDRTSSPYRKLIVGS